MRIFPFKTNLWDRFFYGISIMFALHLIWVRFLEQYVPLYVATLGSLIFLAILVITG